MYYIAMLTEGTMKALDFLPSYSEAEDVIDTYCDQYPNAWIEIVSKHDYDQCIAVTN